MKYFVKSEKGYDQPFEADWEEIKSAMKKVRIAEKEAIKVSTSIELEPGLFKELKKIAKQKKMNYQSMMKLFVVEGLHRIRNPE
jgi:predicted DNA-binding ribbon-helix-helix protein